MIRKRWPSQGSPVLRDHLWAHLALYNQPMVPTLQPSTLPGCHIPGHYPLSWSPQGQEPDNSGQPCTPKPAGIINVANARPAYPASPVLFLGNHNQGSRLCFPQTPSASWLEPLGFLCVVWGTPSAWELGVTTLLLMAVFCCSAGLMVLEWGQNLHCKTLSSSLSPPVSPLLPPLHFPPPHSFPATSVSILFLNDFSTLLLWDLCFRVLSIWKVLPDFSFIKFLIFLCLLTAYLLNKPKFMDTTQSSSSLLIPYLLIISCSFLFFLLYHPE